MRLKHFLTAMVALLLVSVSTELLALDKPVYGSDKTSITIKQDSPEFVIKLKSNPTTGYSWFLKEFDAALITPMKHHFVSPDSSLIGASGYEEWSFLVKPEGFKVPTQMTLRFVYARPWSNSPSDKQLLFKVSTLK